MGLSDYEFEYLNLHSFHKKPVSGGITVTHSHLLHE